jgi:thiol-disulfide isomerase/thioredoxin
MDIQLYVYDLSQGLARSMSKQFLGIQIDAVYHTSLVFNNVEYFFGAGVQTCYPGASHHGRPMEIIPMGKTDIDLETILDYLESLKQVYTPESYDLFAHNCNNFTHDFSMFLLGKGIPSHITSLPQRVLDTPFGRMLQPQIDASMRSVTQAPVPNGARPPQSTRAVEQTPKKTAPAAEYGKVVNITSNDALQKALSGTQSTCATVFFTSSTCAPCKMAYPAFDSLAEEHGNALFVKVDINEAQDIATNYQVRATPTFMTFSKGAKFDEWTGADPNLLKTNVAQLMQHTFPPHAHTLLKLPTLQYGSMAPITYPKVPPIEKLTAKLGSDAQEPEFVALTTFVKNRQIDVREAKLPDIHAIGEMLQTTIENLPLASRFAAVDLLRCAMVDPRVSGFFAGEKVVDELATVPALIQHVVNLEENCPHNLRLVTIHLACNIFSSPLYVKELLKPGSPTTPLLIQLITSSLLDAAHDTTRVAAASLAFNLTVANYRLRREENREGLAEGQQVELAASMLEALRIEAEGGKNEAIKALLLSLGYLLYHGKQDGEVAELMSVLDARGTIEACVVQEKLAAEVANLL